MKKQTVNNSLILGYLYVATGKRYLEEAITSAQTLKAVTPEAKVFLVTDHSFEHPIFDIIKVVAFEVADDGSWKSNLIYKIIGIQNSPFDRTVFLDTDMYIVHTFHEVFQTLDHFDFLACLDYYDQSEVMSERQVVPYFTPYNTGMLVFRKTSETEKFLLDWESCYRRGKETYWSDQPAFMEALLSNPIKMYVLHSSFNFRFLFNVGFLENEIVRIIHGRASREEFKIIAKRVNQSSRQRVWVASLRKCYGWSLPWHKKLLRQVYSWIPEGGKKLLRSLR